MATGQLKQLITSYACDYDVIIVYLYYVSNLTNNFYKKKLFTCHTMKLLLMKVTVDIRYVTNFILYRNEKLNYIDSVLFCSIN